MNCPNCGAQIPDNATFCGFCGNAIQTAQPQYQQPQYQQPQYQQPQYQQYQQPVYQQPARQEKPENIVAGILGAVIGALLGAASIVLFGQMNMVAALSGLILAFCTLKGYELLGGKLSTTGIVISVVLMLVVPYFANVIDWAITVSSELGVPFDLAVERVFQYGHELDNYTSNLVMIYLFTILGGASTVMAAFKNKKK